MNRLGAGVIFALLGVVTAQRSTVCTPADGSVHDFSATTLDGSETVNFADLAGKEQYPDDLVVLGFPCNQFKSQEPGANATEIYNALMHVRPGGGFQPNFQLFAKSEVNGPNASALYKYLRNSCAAPAGEFYQPKGSLMYEDFNANDIRWNFEKFLIDQDGLPYMRFEPLFHPDGIAAHIDELLAGKAKNRNAKKTKGTASSPLRRL